MSSFTRQNGPPSLFWDPGSIVPRVCTCLCVCVYMVLPELIAECCLGGVDEDKNNIKLYLTGVIINHLYPLFSHRQPDKLVVVWTRRSRRKSSKVRCQKIK